MPFEVRGSKAGSPEDSQQQSAMHNTDGWVVGRHSVVQPGVYGKAAPGAPSGGDAGNSVSLGRSTHQGAQCIAMGHGGYLAEKRRQSAAGWSWVWVGWFLEWAHREGATTSPGGRLADGAAGSHTGNHLEKKWARATSGDVTWWRTTPEDLQQGIAGGVRGNRPCFLEPNYSKSEKSKFE